jgi:hypothetical protein
MSTMRGRMSGDTEDPAAEGAGRRRSPEKLPASVRRMERRGTGLSLCKLYSLVLLLVYYCSKSSVQKVPPDMRGPPLATSANTYLYHR